MSFSEPNVTELEGMTNIGKAADWAELSHRSSGGEDDASPRGTFLKLMGAAETNHPRLVAGIPEDMYKDIIHKWKIGSESPTAVQMVSAGLLGTACRLAAGTMKRAEVIDKEKAEAESRKLRELELQAQISTAQSAASTTSGGNEGQAKMSTLVDQTDEREIKLMNSKEMLQAYSIYEKRQGAEPRPEQDITVEQLSALKTLFASDSVPYVDLSIWGPFGRRTMKRLKLSGLVMGPDGKLQHSQLFGPANWESWIQGMTIFKTGAIMLEQLTPATCDNYVDHIVSYAQRYRTQVWPLIYQADVRARGEHIERGRRSGLKAYEMAKANGGTTDYDPARPWEWAIKALIADQAFWHKQVEEPALLVLAEVSQLANNLGGDAPVSGPDKPLPWMRGAAKQADRAATEPKPRKREFQKVHNVNSDGLLTHNRRGTPLCMDYQKGECSNKPGTIMCPKDRSNVHQCAKCLHERHGAHRCNNEALSEPSSKRAKGGKGKGKKGEKRWGY